MKRGFVLGMCVLVLLPGASWAQKTSCQATTAAVQPAAAAGSDSPAQQLNDILSRMDQAAQRFKTTQADFVWEQYSKVVNETDTQKGTLYFRRSKSGVEMAAHITQPAEKYVLFADSKVRVYQPAPLDQETVYNTGKNKADVESFMVLGFGGRGHDLLKSFNVRYLGMEEAQGIKADKLELEPKSQKLRNTFAQILLWIDPSRGVSVQQEFLEPSGDHRLAKYSQIQINTKIPENAFKLKTTGNTKVMSP